VSENKALLAGSPDWPIVWTTYSPVNGMEADLKALKKGGVGLVSIWHGLGIDRSEMLSVARASGMKCAISMPDITEHAGLVGQAGLEPVRSLMIAGVYRGKAIDRHVFTFAPHRHEVLIEPPVYSRDFPYTLGSGSVGVPKDAEPVGHYFPDIAPPVRAEAIVPLKPYDGKQHLKIIPAEVSHAPADSSLELDSVSQEFADLDEARDRTLYKLSFDLAGLDGAMLDRVGLAVYWEYGGSENYWMFRGGEVSAAAKSTRQALRAHVRDSLQPWIDANGGEFPTDVIIALRYGDECWHVCGHLNGPAVNYPLWDYSAPPVDEFEAQLPGVAFPRTWGFPEIYGPDAYAWWQYLYHRQCAELAGIVRNEVAKIAPGLLVFRNQTRAGVFKLTNDHDGSGQELLTRNLDLVHLDPYPVSASGYQSNIPRDMSYCAGLARRYGKPLLPWMQAHTYGGIDALIHPGPEDIDRMSDEQYAQGPDAVMWLGWGGGNTFPDTRPESWQRAIAFHKRLAENPAPKPKAVLAVLRSYVAWSVSSRCDGHVRNPADWLLQQLLEVWAVKRGLAYDVFEIPPSQTPEQRDRLANELKRYDFIVSTQRHEGAWVIGEGTDGQEIDPSDAPRIQDDFERELISKGWLSERN